MHFIIDSNIIFSALLGGPSKFRSIFKTENKIYAPLFLTEEIKKHHNKIIKCSNLSENEIDELVSEIYHHIHFVDGDLISKESRKQAYDLCKDIDLKDTPFIALALETKMPLMTGDKILKEGLKQKGFNHFFEINTTDD